ncbi:hypothetical protein [Listeria booriae]|uniref:DUF4145 domain-containing protein n=1 Tax=Listeria booriae TaxID=1552123 RepID=A0A842EZB7_9LIST|nr:hypothetical protein [Listeria booriae]MBC2241838.1 hypothetical protein [Listeria booriae]
MSDSPWLFFVSSLIKALAWPTVILLVLFMFSRQLKQILERIVNVKYKDLDITLDLDKVMINAGINLKKIEEPRSEFTELQANFPSAAIIVSWLDLEKDLYATYESSDKKGHTPTIKMITQLQEQGFIDNRTYNLIRELNAIRNSVVHSNSSGFIATQDDAKKFEAIAEEAKKGLKSIES